jgi:hypothetical protein
VALAAALAFAGAPAALADDWCSSDPLVKVVTPGGSPQYVHLTVAALGTSHRQALQGAAIAWAAAPMAGGTEVTLTVTVPPNASPTAFPMRALVSTKPFGGGAELDRTEGAAGAPLRLVYRLAVA